MPGPVDLPAWKALEEHQRAISGVHMRDLFAQDPQRFERFSLMAGDILFDYSKNRITQKRCAAVRPGPPGEPGAEDRSHVQRAERSTPPRTAPSCTWRCATAPTGRSSWTARM